MRNLRRDLRQENLSFLVMTISGLVAQILKEGLISYKEDKILEEIALWQSVQDNIQRLDFFSPIAHYPGFIKELKLLFRQIDLKEQIFESVPQEGRAELELLQGHYQDILNRHGVLDTPGQIKLALEVVKRGDVMGGINEIRLQGLGELSPLEQELVTIFAKGRPVNVLWPRVEKQVIKVRQAGDPVAEVEMIGQALREQIEKGIALEKLGVAFPNPSQYLPILLPVFSKMKIPWSQPEVTLRNTPIGKSILAILLAELQGWHKYHFEQLIAPGWGFPFNLSAKEHRLLRLAPPLKGLPAWRNYLGSQSGWEEALEFLTSLTAGFVRKPLKEYGIWLEHLLAKIELQGWFTSEQDLENWVEAVKAWDGLYMIALNLQKYSWDITPEQFVEILQNLLDSYNLQNRRIFAEQIQILSVEQLGAYSYEQLYVGGLVEGQFPPRKNAHWLTKNKPTLLRDELNERLLHGAPLLHLFYPEVDSMGKLNLPATILPKIEEENKRPLLEPMHNPSLFLGDGNLREQEVLATVQTKILEEGLSVSRLNSYANCPYQFFCSYILDLEPLEEISLELDARERGNLVHDVLNSFWQEHLVGTLPQIKEGQARIEGLLLEAYSQVESQPPARLIRVLRDFIRNDLLLAERGFRPNLLEKWFQGLVIKTSFGPVEIRGRIDRIDLHPQGYYILYDYKTGSAPQIKAMLAGKDIQIATYLLAAQDLLPHGKNVGAAYYLINSGSKKGIFRSGFHKAAGVSRGDNVLDEIEFYSQKQEFSEILTKHIENILQGKFPIDPVSSRICTYCGFQGVCRKEVGS